MAVWHITYEVTGRLPFPIDMLRYDSSHPIRSEDAVAIEQSMDPEGRHTHQGEFRVRLGITAETPRLNTPTHGRWESFGWKIDQSTIKREKS